MKQYASFQRLDIICSIQCLTEFYLKRFLPDLLLIQLGGFRKGGKFSVCEHTHGIAVLHRVGKAMQNHHNGPALLCKALQKFHQLELCCTGNFGCQRRSQKGKKARARVQNNHILIKFAHVLDDLILALARLLENVPGRQAGTGRSEKNGV